MNSLSVFAVVAVFAGAIVSAASQAQEDPHSTQAHTRKEFSFLVNASYDETFPLFGAYEEREWAVGFNPQFVFPSSPHDQEGMVFTTQQEGKKRIWVNTAFDQETGRAQYVYFIPETMVSLIDVRLTKSGNSKTKVDVTYERTALTPDANHYVTEMAAADADAGPHWAAMINGYFANARAQKR
jgi:hypothetical protein